MAGAADTRRGRDSRSAGGLIWRKENTGSESRADVALFGINEIILHSFFLKTNISVC
jgi:hypothetical protein